jgi:hypothetical protein
MLAVPFQTPFSEMPCWDPGVGVTWPWDEETTASVKIN